MRFQPGEAHGDVDVGSSALAYLCEWLPSFIHTFIHIFIHTFIHTLADKQAPSPWPVLGTPPTEMGRAQSDSPVLIQPG